MTEDLDPDRPVARRAVPADAAELTCLRSVMFEAMGTAADDGWHAACEADLAELLAGDAFAAFVVDAPEGSGLGCSATGSLGRRRQASHRPHRRRSVGHVSSAATDPRWRRRGMARAALEAPA